MEDIIIKKTLFTLIVLIVLIYNIVKDWLERKYSHSHLK